MIDFEKAISIAKENARILIPDAKDFVLEEVLLSEDRKLHEVTLSYLISGKDPLSGSDMTEKFSAIQQLAKVMSTRREYKVFLVDSKTGVFRGFKNQKSW